MLKLLWWALVGLAIGLLGRLIVAGANPIGWLGTILAGMAGAILGGVVDDAFDLAGVLQFILAVLFAAGLIAIFAGKSRTTYAWRWRAHPAYVEVSPRFARGTARHVSIGFASSRSARVHHDAPPP